MVIGGRSEVSIRVAVALLFSVGGVIGWEAAAATAPALGPAVDIHDIGCRLRPPAGWKRVPLPPPDEHVLLDPVTGSRAVGVDPLAFWRASQMAARFVGTEGRLDVVRLIRLPPAVTGGLAPVEIFGDTMMARTKETWNRDELRQWVEAFTGHSVSAERGLVSGTALRLGGREYVLRRPGSRCFVLRMPPGGPATAVVLWFEAADPSNAEPVGSVIASCLRSVSPGTLGASTVGADVRFAGGRAPGERSEAYRRRRDDVIANVRGMPDWWYTELPHYLLVSNLDDRNRRFVKELQDNLEQVRASFAEIWAPRGSAEDVSVVRVFASRAGYTEFVGPENAWTFGVWLPSKGELVISAPADDRSAVKSGATREQILQAAYHEAFHQYVYFSLDRSMLPPWLNEGHAALFEACRFQRNGGGVEILENDDRLSNLVYLRTVLDDAPSVPELMAMDPAAFYLAGARGEEAERLRAYHYATAWALVYFLRKGAPAVFPERPYGQIIDRTIAQVRAAPAHPGRATQAGLRDVDLSALARDFDRFWGSDSLRSKAKRTVFP